MIETLGSVPYCSNPRSRISLWKPMVQYLTAATLDQGNHDRNSWLPYLTAASLDQKNHDRNPWFST
jgi:hypothetical protein